MENPQVFQFNSIRATIFLTGLIATFLVSTLSVNAQESIRNIDQPGDFTKYLTPGMTDRWIFKGSKDETVIAHVTTQEFDSVIQLVMADGDKETVLIAIDDDGSDGWLSFRLPADGKYKICVTGFENKGGGNYSLSMRQFRATATAPGQTQSGTFDRKGKAFYYFVATAGQHFTVDIRGNSSTNWAVLDTQGKPVENWYRLVGTEKDGEYLIELSGRSGHRFEVILRAAEPAAWPENADVTEKLGSREATVIDLPGKTGEFRVLELSFKGELASRLVHAPIENGDNGQPTGGDNQRPEITYLPIGSKGTVHRFAVIWGREDRFQLHLFSESGAEFQATYQDPAIPAASNSTGPQSLNVGNTRYFRVPIQQGETITVRASTSEFDPEMRLFNDSGEQRAGDDDGNGPRYTLNAIEVNK